MVLLLLAVLLAPASGTGTQDSKPTRPAGRACHCAAATRAGVVVWGGAAFCGVGVLSDSAMWQWNGTEWRALAGPPVAPREDALLCSTGSDGALTLIGGRRAGVVSDDVWVFEGDAWRAVPATGGPGAVQHAAAAYDPVRRRVVVFGGALGRTRSDRTHEWDGERWHELDVPGPPPRVGHGMAWSKADGGVLLYGGFADESFRDLWRWDGARWEQLSAEGPTHTEGHVVAEWDDGIHVVGPGLTGGDAVSVWRWQQGKFTQLSEAGPPLLVGATATWDATRRVVLYWGGSREGGAPSAAVHEFDGKAWRTR